MVNDPNDPDLEVFFEAARAEPVPSDDLVARVLADAARLQADQTVIVPAPARPGWLEAIGGWLTVSGLAGACAAGLALGIVLPTALGAGFETSFGVLLGADAGYGFTGFDAVAFAQEFEVTE